MYIMRSLPRYDKLFATISWFIVLALLVSAISMIFTTPASAGPVTSLFGPVASSTIYFLVYLIEGSILGYSKFVGNNTLRKHILLAIYLTGIFTTVLTVIFFGISPRVIDNALMTVFAAACWIHWTFRTEYVTYEDIDKIK